MDFYFHRVERIRRVYQPGHTVLSEKVASAKIRFAQIKTEKSPSIQADSFSVSLNAQGAAGQSQYEEADCFRLQLHHCSKCRAPPNELPVQPYVRTFLRGAC